MSNLAIGLLAALLATNTPLAVSSVIAQATGVPLPTVNTNDPVEQAYQKLIVLDDTALTDIQKWTEDAGTSTTNPVTRLNFDARVQQRLDGVRRAYVDFLQDHPNHPRARLAFGSFLNELHDEEGAVEQWDKARQLDPKNPAAWNNLANYYGHRGPVTNAFAYYQKAIDLDSNEPVYYQNFAVTVYLFRTDAEDFYHIDETQVFDKALDLYRKAMKLSPNDFVLASDYSESFYGTKPPRWEDGLQAWIDTLKIARDDDEREGVYVHLARINWKLNHFAEARHWLDQVTNAGYAVLKNRISRNVFESEHPTNSLATNNPIAPKPASP